MSAIRLLRAATLAIACLVAPLHAAAQSCATTPGGGDVNTAVTGIVNTYYAGSGTSSAGSTSVSVGTMRAVGPQTPVAAGDLILIIQMQDAYISTANDANYGGSGSGAGYTSINSAGKYEYAVATGPAAGSIPLASPLLNTYTQAAANGTTGQRTYQVIRVPQYSSATITGTVTAPVWDGTTGGVVAFDTAGVLNWGGQTIDVNGRGFRGGGGQQSGSDATGLPTNLITDYVSNVGGGTLGGTANGSVPNGVKGEGTAGTPIIVFTPTTPWDNTAGANTNTGGTDGTSGGYPVGSLGRGAPGNGGGGGTDGEVANNQQNTGGAGGGNYGPGGKGGFGWTPGTPPGHDGGGMGGAAMPVAPDRLFFGGGGGAASNNNGTGTPTFGRASSGGAGGGIVFVRAGSTTGAGTITARGTSANNSVLNDASGGGGAGGTALVFVDNGGAATGVSIDLRGGDGGSNTPGAGANCPHGPGGGGSGGYAAVSGTTSVNVAGGVAGLTCANAFTPQQYGSTASVGGFSVVNLGPGQIPGSGSSRACFPQLTVTKSTTSPYVPQGGVATWTISVANAAGKSTAASVNLTDVLPANPNITYAATGTVALGGGATRAPVTNPTVGATSPAWSTFSIPGGGSVGITFTANVAAAVATGTYQNPAAVTYLDPTRVAGSPLITPGGPYAAGGALVGGSNYASASTTNEDILVVAPPTFTKTFTPAAVTPGNASVLTLVLANPGSVALTNAAFTDTYPAGLVNTAAPNGTLTGAGCLGTVAAIANGPSVALSGATIPAGGSCTVTVNVTVTAIGTYTNTLPVGALTNTQNISNTAASSATLSTTITVAKSFLPTAVAPGAAANLRLVITNPNAAPVSLANPGLTDTFPSLLRAVGGPITVTPAGCTGFAPTTIAANATSVSFTAGTIPGAGTCTISFDVYSNTTGIYNNTSTGVTTLSPAVTGPPSNTASLGVGVINIAKAFSPSTIQSGGTSAITYTLSNPTGVAQTGGAFLDTMLNMQAVGGGVTGTCVGTTPNTFAAGATSFNFTGIQIPAGAPTGTCTVIVNVTSTTVGTNPNAANGVTTSALPQGPGSNTDNLIVVGKPTIAKAFVPNRIAPAGTSTITFTLTNPNTIALTGATFTDPLPVNLSISGAQAAGGSCTGAGTNNFTAGQTGTLNFSGLSIPVSASCTVTVVVTGTVLGAYNNTTTGVVSTQSGTAGTASNTAVLTIASPPTIGKVFGTPTINQGAVSTITFTIANPNTIALTGLNFTDALTGMSVQSATIGGTCTGVTNAPALAAGATSLNLTIPTLAAGASCTILIDVTSNVSGAWPNTTSGVISNETVRGPASGTVNLTVLAPPTLAKAFVSSSIEAGANANIVFTITNPNPSNALTGIAFSDTLTNMALAAGTAVTTTCAGVVGNTGVAALSTSFSITLTTLAAATTCTITVSNVTSAIVSPAGGHPNTTSTVNSVEASVNRGAAATGYLNVYGPPTVTKSFSPNGIASGGTSVVTFTITNPNANPLTDVRFTDDLPANLLNSAAQSFIGAGRGTCTGTIPSAKAAGNVDPVNFTSTTVPANSSCTIMMDVTSTTVGSYTNTATLVRSNQTPTNTTGGSDVLSVGRVAVTKSFRTGAPGTAATVVTDIPLNTVFWLWVDMTNQSGGTRSAFIITDNWAASATGVTVDNGVGPTGQALTVSTSGTCTGLAPATINEGSTSYTTTALSLGAGVNCVVGFPLIATTAGTKSNTATTTCTPADTLCNNSDTATIRAWAPPTIAKAFAPATIGAGATSTVTLTLTNPAANTGPLTGAAFTDTLVNMTANAAQTVGGTCPGITPATLTAGQTALAFTGITIPSGGSCTVTFVVTSTTAGVLPNSTSGVTTTQTPTAGAGSAVANLTVVGSALTKAFSPTSITAGTNSQLTFTVTNGAGNPAQSPLAFTETLPGNVLVAAVPNAATTCTGGTVTATAGTNTIALSGASFATGGTTCTVTVNVTSSVAGVYNNLPANIGGLSPGLSAAGLSATLTVAASPALTKAFNPASIAQGATSQLVFTITNGAGTGPKTGLGFTDTLPANVVVAGTPAIDTNCPAGGGFGAPSGGMAVTAAAGSGSIAVTSAALNNAVASCQVRVNVTATALGNFTNNSTNISALAGGLTAAGVNATLSAVGTSLAKSFTPAIIGRGGVSQMTFTITNGAGNPAQSGLGFIENLPANIFVAPTPGVANTCGGTVTAVAGAGTTQIANGALAAGVASCTLSINVTSAFVATYINDASRIVSPSATLDKSGVNATLTVLENPVVTKGFNPVSIPASSNSLVTITLTNTNAAALTGAAFTDTMPAALTTVAATAATTCGGTASQTATSVSLAGGTIPAGGSCTVTVSVTGTTVGTHTNTIPVSAVTTTNGGANATLASADLTIVARPTITKAFAPAQIGIGGTSTLTITLANANAALTLTGAAFTDTLPTNVTTVAATAATTCGGTASQTGTTVSLAGGSIPAAGSCTVTVNVTSSTVGSYTNTIAASGLSTTNGGTNVAAATANLAVLLAPTTVKAFTASSIFPGATSVLSIAITNPNTVALTGVAFTDNYGAAPITNTGTPNGLLSGASCTGTVTAANNGTSVALSGGGVPASSTCTVTVNVTSSTVGVHTNSTGAISTTNAGTGTAATANLTVVAGITATKGFAPATIQIGQPSTLTITLTNSNTTTTVTGIGFTDTYPGGVTNSAAANGTTNCPSGSVTAANNGPSVALSGAQLAPGASCTVTVQVTSSTASAAAGHLNSIGNVTAANAPTQAGGTANLVVFGAPTLTKAFGAASIASGATTTLTITVTNPAANSASVAGITVRDVFPTTPAAMTLANTTVVNSCGGATVTDQSGGVLTTGNTGVRLNGISLTPGASCSVQLTVTATGAGSDTNTTDAITATSPIAITGGTASASLGVVAAPTFSKAFSPATIGPGGTSTLTFTITNPAANAQALTGVAFGDTFPTTPGAMLVALTPAASTTGCGTPTFAPAASAASIAFSGGTIAAGATCTVSVAVTAPTAGTYNNTSGTVSTTGPAVVTGSTAASSLTVTQASLNKVFSPTPVDVNVDSTLTFTLTNGAGNPAQAGINFTDNLPTNVVVAPTPAIATNCPSGVGAVSATAGATSIVVTGASMTLAQASCTISVAVRSATAGTYTNATANIVSPARITTTGISTNLVVQPIAALTKAFGAANVGLGQTTTLVFSIANNAAGAVARSGISFTDALPGGLVIANPTAPSSTACGSPVFTALDNTQPFTASSISVAAGATCAITLTVRGTTLGAKVNGATEITAISGMSNGVTNQTLTVVQPSLNKAFAPTPVDVNVDSTLTFTLTNGTGSPAQAGINFTDNLPTNVVVAPTPAIASTCPSGVGAVAAAAGATSIVVTGASMNLAQASCTISVAVRSATAGTYTNATANIVSTQRITTTGISTNLVVQPIAALTKAFGAANVGLGQTTTLVFSIANNAAGAVARSGLSFTDGLPAGLVIANPTAPSSTACGSPAFTALDNTQPFSASSISVAAGATCSITLTVRGTTLGAKVNGATQITAISGMSNGVTDQTLTVVQASLNKVFAPTPVDVNVDSTLTFTLTNGAGNPAQAGIDFTDNLPTNVVVAPTPAIASTCPSGVGAVGAAAGATSIVVTGASMSAAQASCTISVAVRSATAGTYINATANIVSTARVTTTGISTNLVVQPIAALTKAFGAANVGLGQTTTLVFSIANTAAGAVARSGISFTDALPAGLVIANPTAPSSTACGSPAFTALDNTQPFTASSISVAAGATCSITLTVRGATLGAKVNGATQITSITGASNGVTDQTLTVVQPSLNKVFSPTPVDVNVDSTLTFTLTNGTGNPAQAGINFTDNLPTNVVVAPTPAIASTCPSGVGAVTAAAGATSIVVTGASMSAAQASCTISVAVRSATAGTYTNATANIVSTQRVTTTGISTNLVVQALPTLSKLFNPTTVGVGQPSALTFTITNPATAPARSGLGFTDTLVSGLIVATPNGAATTCGGTPTITAVAGSGSIVVSGATVPAGLATCTVSVNVTSNTAGSYNNATADVAPVGMNNGVGTQTLTVGQASLNKVFAPTPVDVNVDSTLTFTLTNSAGNPAQSGINFTDNLPTNVVVAPTPAIASNCPSGVGAVTAAAGATSIVVTGASMTLAQASCTISVAVRSATAGTYTNATANIVSPARITTTGISTNLVVQPIAALTKAFGAANVGLGQTTTLVFSIANTAAGAVARSGISFTDTLPPGLVIANPTAPSSTACGSPAFTALDNTQPFSASSISVAAGATCSITLTVRGATLGAKVNGALQITAISGIANGVTDQTLTVVQPSLNKAFSPTPVDVNVDSTLTFTLTNGTGNPAQAGINFTDNLPTNVVVGPTPAIASTCPSGTGVVAAAAGATSIVVTGASMSAAQASCTISVAVRSATAGTYTNATANIVSPARITTTGISADLVVQALPSVTKAFLTSPVGVDQASVLRFTITNPASAPLRSGLQLTDNLPPGLVIAATPGAATTCGGAPTFTATAGTGTFGVGGTGVSVPAGLSTCTVSVNVSSATAGSYINGAANVATTGLANAVTNQTLVVSQASLNKVFSPTPVDVNVDSTLTFTLTNGTGNPAQSGINFTDNLPTNVVVAPTPAIASNCPSGVAAVAAAAGATSIVVTGASMTLAQASCTISVAVRSATPGTYTNASVNIVSPAHITTTGISTNLVVQPIAALTKAFGAANVGLGQTTTLVFSIANTAAGAVARSGISFTDTLPPGLVIANPAAPSSTACGVPAFTALDNTQPFSASSISVAAGATCSITLTVRGATLGAKVNGNTQITAISGISNGVTDQTLTVVQPSLTKVFAPAAVDVNVDSTLTFTLTNGTGNPAQAGINFADNLPGNVVVAPTPAIASTCPSGVGAVSAAAGATSIVVTGASMSAAQTSCTISVAVRSATAGTYSNTDAANITGQQRVTTTGVNATLTIQPQPLLTKAFGAANVGLGQTTTLVFSIANTAAGAVARSGISFTDALPPGIAIANPAAPTSSNCGAPAFTAADGTQPFTAASLSVAAGATCSITLTVRGTALGAAVNGSTQITSISGAINNVTNQTLTVVQAALTKSFAPAIVDVNTDSTLTFTLTNGAGNPAQAGINFTDGLPAGVVVSPTPAIASTCPSGTGVVTATAGSGTVTVTGATMGAALASCTISVAVRAAASGTYNNTDAGNITGQQRITTTGVNATLTVQALPTLTKAFNPTTAGVGQPAALVFTLTNSPGSPGRGGLGFTDTLVAGLLVATPNGVATTCPGAPPTITAVAGSGTITVSGANVAAGPATCTVTVNVSAAATGSYVNDATNVAPVALNNGVTPQTLTVVRASLDKAFSPTTINIGGTSTLTFTLTNGAGNPAQAGISFSDSLPGNVIVGATPNVQTNCPAGAGFGVPAFTVTAAAGSTSASFSNVTIANAVASCQVRVDVTSNVTGSYTNNSGNVTATGITNSVTPSTLTVNATAPTVTKAFTPASIASGATSTLAITIANANNVPVTVTSVTDTFPTTPGTGLVRAPTPAASTTCASGVVTHTAGSVTLTGGVVPANSSCSFRIDVTAATAGTYANTIAAGALTSTAGANTAAANASLTVTPVANLAVVKSGPATVGYGATATYTIVVSNAGPDAANSASFSDAVPVKLGSVAASCGSPTGGAACGAANVAGNAVTSTITTLPAGGSVTFTVSGVAIDTGSFTNTATIAPPVGTTDPVAANDSSSVTTTILAPDLAITKTHAGNFTVGTNGTYTITVSNGGTLATSGTVTVSDALPTGLGFVSASGTGWACANAAGTVTCTTSNAINPAASAPAITLVVSVASVAAPSVTNFATVGGGNEPPALAGNNTASDNTIVVTAAVNTFVPNGAQTALPGTVVFYPHTFTAGLAGSVSFATSAVITPATPGWTQLIYRDTNCNGVLDGVEGNTQLTTPVVVVPGDTVCIVVKDSIPATAAYNSLNRITVTATFGAQTYTVQDVTTVGAVAGAGLTLAKSVRNVTLGGGVSTANTARPNDVLEYTITYTNTSPGLLSSIVVTDPTPAFTLFVSAACPAPPPNLTTCTVTTAPAVGATGSVVWTLGGSLLSNGSGNVTYQVRVAP